MSWIALLLGSLAVAAGILNLILAFATWDWLMRYRQAQIVASALGRAGTRVFYLLCGLAAIALGAWLIVAWAIWG
jgi:hypothetical protein